MNLTRDISDIKYISQQWSMILNENRIGGSCNSPYEPRNCQSPYRLNSTASPTTNPTTNPTTKPNTNPIPKPTTNPNATTTTVIDPNKLKEFVDKFTKYPEIEDLIKNKDKLTSQNYIKSIQTAVDKYKGKIDNFAEIHAAYDSLGLPKTTDLFSPFDYKFFQYLHSYLSKFSH